MEYGQISFFRSVHSNMPQQLSQSILILLSIMYTSTQLLALVIVGKLIETPLGTVSAGSLVSPFWFLFNDMIAELYGYKISRIVFWSAMCCELIFVLAASLMLKFPSPSGWLGTKAFALVLGHLPLIYFAQLLAIIVAWHINTKFLLKWKFLTNGRVFWLRSISSSAIGEILFSIIAASIIMSGMMSEWEIQSKSHSNFMLVIHLVIWSAILKIIFTSVFTIPASIIVSLLKRCGIDYTDINFHFNPFQQNSQNELMSEIITKG